MNKAKETLRHSYEQILIDRINEKGGHAESPEDIWLNLQFLTTSYTRYGEEKLVISLQIKKILAYILDPDYHIEYEVTKTEKDCVVKASFFWGGEETPAGYGIVKRYINQIFPNDGMSYEERDSIFESTVRGLAATRAITDAGIAMQFYADSLEIDPESADSDKVEPTKDKAEVPSIPSNNQKKMMAQTKPRTDKTASSSQGGQNNTPVENEKARNKSEETVIDMSRLFNAPMSDNQDQKKESGNPAPSVSNSTPSQEEIEWAKGVVIDIGNFEGHPLGKLLEYNKHSAIIWLSNNAHGDVKKAATILIHAPKGTN